MWFIAHAKGEARIPYNLPKVLGARVVPKKQEGLMRPYDGATFCYRVKYLMSIFKFPLQGYIPPSGVSRGRVF